MLYCDLTLDSTVLWTGVRCMYATPIKSANYINFIGNLVFIDVSGTNDPTYDGLMSRYFLVYLDANGIYQSIVPLQPVPSQKFAIVINGQNCVISIYEGLPG
jgi:hypothetical protein